MLLQHLVENLISWHVMAIYGCAAQEMCMLALALKLFQTSDVIQRCKWRKRKRLRLLPPSLRELLAISFFIFVLRSAWHIFHLKCSGSLHPNCYA